MYTVTAKIPLEFDFETTAKDKNEAVEKFWDKINEMDGLEFKQFLANNLTYERNGKVDPDDVDWEEVKPYVSGEREWYYRDPDDGEVFFFDNEEEAREAVDRLNDKRTEGRTKFTRWCATLEWRSCHWDEDGEYIDGIDTEDREEYSYL